MVQKIPSKKALRHVEDIVYEFERWQPVVGWGNKSMLPTDPGRSPLTPLLSSWSTGSATPMNMEQNLPVHLMRWLLRFLMDGQFWMNFTVWSLAHIYSPFPLIFLQGNNWEYSVDLTRSDWYTKKGKNSKSTPMLSIHSWCILKASWGAGLGFVRSLIQITIGWRNLSIDLNSCLELDLQIVGWPSQNSRSS